MSDERDLNNGIINDDLTDGTDEIDTEAEGVGGEEEIADIDPAAIIDEDPELDGPIETPDGEVINPDDNPFGFEPLGELDEDGEWRPREDDDEEEPEDAISEDLF